MQKEIAAPFDTAQRARPENMIEALGALDGRKAAFRVHAKGSRWEPLQGQRPHGPPLRPSDFAVTATHDLRRDRMRLSWTRHFIDPLTATVTYDEIVAGDAGHISGADVALHPSAARPMPPDRLAAIRRQQHLLHPQLLIGAALRLEQQTGRETLRRAGCEAIDGRLHDIVEIEAYPRPIRLFFDRGSLHLAALATWENDHPRGDVLVEVRFEGWQVHDGLAIPRLAELRLDGATLHRETRTEVAVAPPLDDADFRVEDVEGEPGPRFDAARAARGLANAQWIHRALAMGAPISLDAGPVEPAEIVPGVMTLGGGIHHSMAIAHDGGVVVIDAPQHEDRSRAVIDTILSRWPGRPITHLVLTHHHHDHSGGIRAFAALGAELVVAEGDREFVARCLAAPHTILPDSLAASGTRAEIVTVGDAPLALAGGAVAVHRISSPHCAEDLVVHVPRARLLFNADLFNPGLVPRGKTPPPHWLEFSRDFRRKIEALDLDIDLLVGAHGAPEGRPWQSLIDFTE